MLVPAAKAVTIHEGDLIRGPDGIKVYIVNDKGYKRHIFNPAVFNMYGHLKWENIKDVSQDLLDSYKTSDLYRAAGDSKVYSLEEINPATGTAVKHWLDMTPAEFVAAGYSWDQVFIVNPQERDYYSTGDPITANNTPKPPTTKDVTVSAVTAPSTAAIPVPLKASNVEVLKFKVTAPSDTTLDSVTLTRKGVGSYSDFDYVYLYDGATRLTSGKSISSDTDQVTFTNLGVKLTANEAKTLTVKVDMDSDASGSGNIDYFELSKLSVASGATVTGLPVDGSSISIASSSVGTLTIDEGVTPNNPKVGASQATLAEFKLTAGTAEKVNFSSITLTNSGNLSLDKINNWKLYQGSDVIATGKVSGEQVVFTLDTPYLLDRGVVRTFDVKGDISASARADDTLQLYLEETTDLLGIGQSYGYGAYVTNNFGTGDQLTIQGGDLTISFNGPAATTVAKGATDVDVFDFSLTPQQNVTLKNLYLDIYDGAGTPDFTTESTKITNIKIIDADTGATVLGPVDASSFTDHTSYGSYTFTNDLSLTGGKTHNFKVTLNIASTWTSGSFYIELGDIADNYIFSSTDVRNDDSSTTQYITDIVPNTPIAGHTMTVSSASLTAALASAPAASTYVKGAQKVDLFGVLLTAGSASSVKLSSLKVTANSTSARDYVSAIYLYDGTDQIGTAQTLDSTGVATFDNLNLTISEGATKNLVVKGDVATTLSSSQTVYLKIADPHTDVVGTDTNSNTVNPTSTTAITGPTMTLATSGSLHVTAAADMPDSDILLSGSSDATLAKYKFSADNEAFNVTRVAFNDASSNYDDDISAVKLVYSDENGNTVTKTGYLSSGQVIFDNLSPAFYVPKDGSAYLTVKADIATIGGSGGADSGDLPALSLAKDTTNDDQFKATGSGSGTTLDDDDVYFTGATTTASIAANAMTIRKAKPTITVDALPTTSLTDGTQTLYKFTVTNTSNESAEIGIKKFGFDVVLSDNSTSTALTLDTVKIYKSTDLTNNIAASIVNGSGADITGTANNLTNGTGSIYVKFTNEQSIGAGSSVTYVLKGRITNSAQYDSITTSLKAPAQSSVLTEYLDGTVATSGAYLLVLNSASAGAGTESNAYFIWSDQSTGTSHSADESTSSADWTSGYQVKTLPSDAKSLSR